MRKTLLPEQKASPLKTSGAYYHYRQLISLDDLKIEHFESLRDEALKSLNRKTVRLFFHEATHWLDHVSTLWGQRHLVLIFNAINSRLNNNEHEFWRIATMNTETRRIHYPAYYSTNPNKDETSWKKRPWRVSMTSGRQFDIDGRPRKNKPIAFYNFTNASGEFLCRTPFSVAALLESNATTAEVWLDINYLAGLSETELLFEGPLLDKEAEARIYDPRLTEYSVAAHLVSNKLNIPDTFSAYRIASILGTLALNLPRALFRRIRQPPQINFSDVGFKPYVQGYDRGFAFIALVMHAPPIDFTPLRGPALEDWINKTLANAGLPNLNQLRAAAEQEQTALVSEIHPGPETGRLHDLLSAGRRLFNRRGMYGGDIVFAPLIRGNTVVDVPPVYLGDDKFVQIGEPCAEESLRDPGNWIHRIYRYEEQLDEFLAACLP